MITLSHLLILKNQLKEQGLICVIVEEYFFGFLLVASVAPPKNVN